ncbi:heme biosynthesis protein HemY [Chthonobacter albigriseus]|uniref:heme biosynthesis protein HemY n=1 Tax=Chthonobacter albigriseus TaxID=1683161 RepID=UPI0015EF3EA7|nr:heme biosynthesis HemY N-terminal domain-containing protein [Chthonobacter albigriseus]
MIRVLVAIALLFAAVFTLDWLGGVPVSVAINWPGGEMAPPLRVVVVSLLVFALAAIVLWKLVSGLFHTPGAIRGFFRARRRDKGYQALSRGMIAVGSGDIRLAHRYAGEAGRHLSREPLVMLLEAQTAQLEGRPDAARSAFTRMLEDPDTRLLGLRGLFIEATRAGESEAARHYAAEAQKIAPGVPWSATAMMEYQSAEHDWEGALSTLEQAAGTRLLEKSQAKRLRAVLLTARAADVEDAEPDKARAFALEAHRLVPEFVPAAVLAARVLTRLNDTRKAAKVVETTWKLEPHPELAEAFIHVRPGDSTHDRLKRAQTLYGIRPNAREGAVAVARAALDAQEWDLAREYLGKALRLMPTQRICLMMAELEERQHGDRGRVREWLSRAVRAPRDEAWTADGVVAETWHPVSPVTGRLDAFEWRVPVATDTGATELDGSDLAERAALPLEAPPPPPVVEASVSDDDGDDRNPPAPPPPAPEEPGAAFPADSRPVQAATPEPAPAEARPAARSGSSASMLTMPFRPDDPGPGGEAVEPTPSRVFV